jgi:hypothetical protein
VRFKLRWKRSGIILIHLGLIVLLLGEVFASLLSHESQMMIQEGQVAGYAYDLQHVELAISNPSPTGSDVVTVLDSTALKPGAEIQIPSLPFQIRVDNYFANSALLGPMQHAEGAVKSATAGINAKLAAAPQSKSVGTDSGEDMASAFITMRAGNRDLGTYLFTQWANSQVNLPDRSQYFGFVRSGPDEVNVDGKSYRIELRFRRVYKPYSITLLKFSHDRYPGTNEFSNFASVIRLKDPSRHVDREVRIWMNHPLTYQGETFYQSSFSGDHISFFQVASNPAWPMPYIGLALGFVGMLIHFGIILTNFLRRRMTQVPVPARIGRGALAETYTLEPQSNLLGWTAGIVTAILAILVVIGVAASTSADENGFDLAGFGQLPVMSGGRVMPLDTLARTDLRIISNRETFKDPQGRAQPAIRWLIDTMSETPAADDYKVFRVDHPEVITQLGLDASQKYFSLSDLLVHKDVLQAQLELVKPLSEKERDLYQKRIAELF